MASDGSIYVGMSFGTVKSACKQVADTARKIGTTVERNHDSDKYSKRGEYSVGLDKKHKLASVSYSTTQGYSARDLGTKKSVPPETVYNAKLGGKWYVGSNNEYYGNNQDAIMQLKFTRVYSADGLQYAEDKNGNGIVDKGEIFDCMW